MAFILLRCNTATNKRLQRVLQCKRNYTTNATKQRKGLYRGFSCDCTHSTAHDTRHHLHAGTLYRSAQAAYYNKVYKRAANASGGGSAPTVCGSLASATPVAPAEGPASPLAQGQPGGVSMFSTPGGWRSGTGSAGRAGGLASSTRRGSPAARERGGRRGTIGGFRRISFRAFAR